MRQRVVKYASPLRKTHCAHAQRVPVALYSLCLAAAHVVERTKTE
jgi:hypothetical protein